MQEDFAAPGNEGAASFPITLSVYKPWTYCHPYFFFLAAFANRAASFFSAVRRAAVFLLRLATHTHTVSHQMLPNTGSEERSRESMHRNAPLAEGSLRPLKLPMRIPIPRFEEQVHLEGTHKQSLRWHSWESSCGLVCTYLVRRDAIL